MEDIRESTGDRRVNIKDRIKRIEQKLKYGQMKQMTDTETKEWKFPFKWRRQMNKSTGRAGIDHVLMIYLNIKGEIETPKLVPLFSGSIIIYKNKAYEFDPRAVWTLKLGKKIIKVILIKEIDRRPISNLDWDEIKKRGDATDSDEILVKMVTKAVIEKAKKPINKGIVIFLIIAVIAAAVLFFFMKG